MSYKMYLVEEMCFDRLIIVGIFKSKFKAEKFCEVCNEIYENKSYVREIATDIFEGVKK